MAKNDIVLIDSIIEDMNANAPMDARRKGELFDQFATEQLLKEYDLSTEELARGTSHSNLRKYRILFCILLVLSYLCHRLGEI